MLCEEDHIRLQVRAAGQDLEGAYAKADQLDDALLDRLPIAFDERLGFLTAVPTNLGTGMQAMLDLHLPALAGQGLIDQLTVMIGKLGLSLQPLYDGHGSFYRLTNQVTLGITEKAAIDNVNAICDQIVRQERNLRQQLQQQDAFLDRIYRAMGTLQMARTLNQDEFLTWCRCCAWVFLLARAANIQRCRRTDPKGAERHHCSRCRGRNNCRRSG